MSKPFIPERLALGHSLRVGRLADLLELLGDMLVDEMPEHPKAEQIRALAFSALDTSRIAENDADQLYKTIRTQEANR